VRTTPPAEDLAGAHPVRHRLVSRLTPTEALRALRDDDRPFALVGSWAGGGALVGSEPVRVADTAQEDPFALLGSVPSMAGPAGFVGGGWFGYLGYGLGRCIERLPPPPPRSDPIPRFDLALYDHLLRWDDAERSWWFEALVTDGRRAELDRRRDELAARLAAPAPPVHATWCGPFIAWPPRERHLAAVASTLDAIRAGDLYQANLCIRLEGDVEGATLDLFATGAEALAPAYGAFVGAPAGQLASFSPELFLRRAGRDVRSSPIKGTAARPADAIAASLERHRLEASAKDRAENVMIVDLVRNDLGRVCTPGTVRAPEIARVEAHPGVWHLVSDVVGTLAPGCDDGDLLRACFPPGSVTGAPKVAAMEHIAVTEATEREAYTGAIGYVSPVAGLELSVTIRTFERSGDRIWLGVGGGVVADSTPEGEWDECLVKSEPLLRAIGAASPLPDDAPVAVR
jgi:para-aminobenzoate synthetase/4-amino-4-deoxychorismate lyase